MRFFRAKRVVDWIGWSVWRERLREFIEGKAADIWDLAEETATDLRLNYAFVGSSLFQSGWLTDSEGFLLARRGPRQQHQLEELWSNCV